MACTVYCKIWFISFVGYSYEPILNVKTSGARHSPKIFFFISYRFLTSWTCRFYLSKHSDKNLSDAVRHKYMKSWPKNITPCDFSHKNMKYMCIPCGAV